MQILGLGIGIGIGFDCLAAGGHVPPIAGKLLLESGSAFLLENGSFILLEG